MRRCCFIVRMDHSVAIFKLFITPFLVIFGLGILGVPKIFLFILLVIFVVFVNIRLRKLFRQNQ